MPQFIRLDRQSSNSSIAVFDILRPRKCFDIALRRILDQYPGFKAFNPKYKRGQLHVLMAACTIGQVDELVRIIQLTLDDAEAISQAALDADRQATQEALDDFEHRSKLED